MEEKLDKIIELLNQITFLLTVHTIDSQPTAELQNLMKEKIAFGLLALTEYMAQNKQ
jgi:hypothetical protein